MTESYSVAIELKPKALLGSWSRKSILLQGQLVQVLDDKNIVQATWSTLNCTLRQIPPQNKRHYLIEINARSRVFFVNAPNGILRDKVIAMMQLSRANPLWQLPETNVWENLMMVAHGINQSQHDPCRPSNITMSYYANIKIASI